MASKRARRFDRAHPLTRLPVLWRVLTGTQAVGLRVFGDDVYAGNDQGVVVRLDRDGAVKARWKLPGPVQCLAVDDAWTLAACNDGKLYDVGGSAAKARFDLGPQMRVGWLETFRGKVLVADAEGGVAAYDVERNLLWEHRDVDGGEGWVVRADDDGVVHGCRAGLRFYDWGGALRFAIDDVDDVRFGVLDGSDLVVTSGWDKTGRTRLRVLSRASDGRFSVRLSLGLNVDATGAESCAADKTRLFASCGNTLFAFARDDGRPLWRAPLAFGSMCNMHVDADGARMFAATTDGSVVCLDVSARAIDAARSGSVPTARVTTLR